MTTPPPTPTDLDPETFRQYGYQVVDWIADYLDNVEDYPVLSRVQPGEIAAQLPASAPDQPEPFEAILNDLDEIIMPGITHWQHPAFFAYFTSSASAPGILGEMLTAAINANGMLWRTSPSATELEERVLDWLRQALGLPAEFKGIITDTASISSLLALAAAREALGLDIREKGLAARPDLPRLRVYTSEQAHSSIAKGAITLGIGTENVLNVPLDEAFRMDVAALGRMIAADVAAGYLPMAVAATVGTTSTTAVDPVPEIAALCREHGIWLHVDAAWAGNAALVPEYQHLLAGVEQADSFVFNPHKWLFTPVDTSCFYVRRPEMLKQAFSLVPEYLRTAHSDVNNYMDWGVQLGRRFRALKLWLVVRMFGLDGLRARLREHLRLGDLFAGWVDAHPDFERMAPNPIATVCFRLHPARLRGDESAEAHAYRDQLNQALMDAVNAEGEIFISHTKLHGKLVLRLAVGNIRTTEVHVQHAWHVLQSHAARLDEMRAE